MADSEFLQAALLYASMGWRVFPLQPRQKDRFGCKSWKKDATTDEAQIRAWWGKNPEYNVGVVTGDGLGVIDVDDKPDKHGGILGSDMLADWEFEHGKLAETVCAQSGSGGVHYYFDIGDWPIRKCESPGLSIDLRCNGGYIVAPPSIHPDTGEPYTWDISPEDMAPAKLGSVEKACFQWIWDNRNGNRGNDAKPDKGKGGGPIPEGGRNAALFSEGRSMRSKGLDYDLIRAALDGKNRMLCRPPLPDEEVEKIAKSVCNVEPGFSEEVKKQGRGRKKTFKHNEVARKLIEEHGAAFVDGIPVVFDGGKYGIGWNAIDRAVYKMHDDATTANMREVRNYINCMAPRTRQSDPRYVAFRNGVLDVETLELHDWSDDFVILNTIPHDWNPSARCEIVDEVFEKIACGDVGMMLNLGEIIGAAMYRSGTIGVTPVLLGEGYGKQNGSNGKSTYMHMVENTIGKENCTALQPKDMGNRFLRGDLAGKLADIADDISAAKIGDDACAVIKRAATGDTEKADVKGKPSMDFNSYCTIIVSANKFPDVADKTFGFMRRLHPLKFSAQFLKTDPDFDPKIGEKLATEEACEYMCAIGVEGLRRILANNGMTPNKTSRLMIARMETDNNSVLLWIEDGDLSPDYVRGRTRHEVYDEYRDWCEHNGIDRDEVFSSRMFSETIRDVWGITASDVTSEYYNGKRRSTRRYPYDG